MFTYFLMGLPFMIAVVMLDIAIFKTRVIKNKQCWIVMAGMIGLTAIFDQVLTGLPVVTYNESKLLGIYIWDIPVEDFMYTFAAVIGLGSISKYYEQR